MDKVENISFEILDLSLLLFSSLSYSFNLVRRIREDKNIGGNESFVHIFSTSNGQDLYNK